MCFVLSVCVIREELVTFCFFFEKTMICHEGGSTCAFISNVKVTSFLCLLTHFYTQPAHLIWIIATLFCRYLFRC